jgi:hypothetical protein
LVSLDLYIKDEDKYILPPANKQKALTMVPHGTGNISPIFGCQQWRVHTSNHELPLLICSSRFACYLSSLIASGRTTKKTLRVLLRVESLLQKRAYRAVVTNGHEGPQTTPRSLLMRLYLLPQKRVYRPPT